MRETQILWPYGHVWVRINEGSTGLNLWPLQRNSDFSRAPVGSADPFDMLQYGLIYFTQQTNRLTQYPKYTSDPSRAETSRPSRPAVTPLLVENWGVILSKKFEIFEGHSPSMNCSLPLYPVFTITSLIESRCWGTWPDWFCSHVFQIATFIVFGNIRWLLFPCCSVSNGGFLSEGGIPKSSILIGCSMINQPAIGVPGDAMETLKCYLASWSLLQKPWAA